MEQENRKTEIHQSSIIEESDGILRYKIDPQSKAGTLDERPAWPPLKVFIYEEDPYHSTDCLYPPELPNRYVNTTGFWWQRMLEPVVHHQFLYSPIRTENPAEADIFIIPHYSRMCSGLDGNKRWNNIEKYMNKKGKYFKRYSSVDHFIMHSVPHYGDKPADIAVSMDKAPIIALLDFKLSKIKQSPWTVARSLIVPFITENAADSYNYARNVSLFVAMSTSTKGLKASSAVLRQHIEQQMTGIPNSLLYVINRKNYSTFKEAVTTLPTWMSHSDMCVVPPGDAPSSKRFYDAISHYCIPYMLADYFLLPYEDIYVEYEKCMRQLSSRRVDEMSANFNAITKQEIKTMKRNLKEVKRRFTWNYEEKPKTGEALWTLSWALYDKMQMLKPYENNEMTGDDLDPEFSIFVS